MNKSVKTQKRRAGVRAEVSQEELLEISCKLMAKRGFHGVTFQAIADEAGVSQTTVLHYFKDRSSLIKRVVQHVLDSNRDFVAQLSLDSKKTKESPLQNYFRGNFTWAKHRPDQASLILLFYYLGSIDPEISEYYSLIRNSARSKIAGVLLESRPASRSKLAEVLHDLFLGGLLNLVSTQSIEEGEKALMDKLDFVYRKLSS